MVINNMGRLASAPRTSTTSANGLSCPVVSRGPAVIPAL
jgi:hypothetical protein